MVAYQLHLEALGALVDAGGTGSGLICSRAVCLSHRIHIGQKKF
jgi:hypothetical protein